MKNVIIIGAGGHAKVIADIVLRSGDRLLGFLDDHAAGPVLGYPVLGDVGCYVNYPDAHFVIGIGSAQVRKQLAQRLDVRWYTAIHPSAVISPLETRIGQGTVVMANVVIGPGAAIGDHCIINTGAIVEHDNKIGSYVHVSVGAKLAGTVTVGEGAWIGIGAVVRNNVSICGGCMVGAGAVVVKNIEGPGTYVGVPARRSS